MSRREVAGKPRLAEIVMCFFYFQGERPSKFIAHFTATRKSY